MGLPLSGVAVALWRLRRQWTAVAQDRSKVRQSVTAWREPWRQCMDVLTETGDLPLDGHRLLYGRPGIPDRRSGGPDFCKLRIPTQNG